MTNLLVTCVVCALTCGACQEGESISPHRVLWVPTNGVTNAGPESFRDGSASVSVSLNDIEPDSVVRALVSHYDGTEWRVASSPSDATSPQRSWVMWAGGGVLPLDAAGNRIPMETRYWRAAWEDASGNLVSYTLKDTRVVGKPGNQVDVHGSYTPATLRSRGLF
jgi:hypothetical protein